MKALYNNWIKPLKYIIPLIVLIISNGKVKLLRRTVQTREVLDR